MIGALSIVRFRHPVKSALELVIYFALITIGIAANRTKWAIQLIICTILIILVVKGSKSYLKNSANRFIMFLQRRKCSNTLEIISKKELKQLKKVTI